MGPSSYFFGLIAHALLTTVVLGGAIDSTITLYRPASTGITWKEVALESDGAAEFSTETAPQKLEGVVLTKAETTSSAVVTKYGCDVNSVKKDNCTFNIVVAVSNCLNASSINLIHQWIAKIKADNFQFKTGNYKCNAKFSTTIVKGCQARSERLNEKGGTILMTDEELIKKFSDHGRVLTGFPAKYYTKTKPEAVISFVTTEKTYTEVRTFERSRDISNVFNFQVCEKGKNCEGKFENCIKLREMVNIFLYNPFKVAKSFHCANSLPGGIPVTYLDSKGNRHCFCQCVAGQVVRGGKCVDATHGLDKKCKCRWTGRKYYYEYTRSNAPAKNCKMNGFKTKAIDFIPYPKSNYVADNRVNQYDSAAVITGARIVVVVRKDSISGAEVFRKTFAWNYFQDNRNSIIDSISLTVPGRYNIQVLAYDYHGKPAKCDTCLAINDKFRPVNTTQCPSSFCDEFQTDLCKYKKPTAEYSPTNLAKANAIVNAHYDFANKAKNDGCSEKRCDSKSFKVRNFFTSTYKSEPWSNGKTCFSKSLTAQELGVLQEPFGPKDCKIMKDDPAGVGVCRRCCEYKTTLKEYWKDYTCGRKNGPPKCDGCEHCSTHQCLVGLGHTWFCANAEIDDSVQKATQKMITSQFPDSGYNSKTQIHYGLQCKQFGDKTGCKVTKSLDQMFDLSTLIKNSALFGTGEKNADKYVSFRYKIQGQTWNKYDGADQLTFDDPITCIVIEAWSKCGIVRKFYFYVYLHPHRKIKVSEEFEHMWYQTSVSRKTPGQMCNYNMSDFAEVTFDFHPHMGLTYDKVKLLWVNTGVTCKLNYDGKSQATIIKHTKENKSFIRRFSIEMVHKATTKAITNLRAVCTFSYKGYGTTTTETATIRFSIKNCDDPHWDCPYGKCSDDCPQALRHVFQSCNGHQVYGSVSGTHMFSGSRACCKTCEKPGDKTMCNRLLNIPGNVIEDVSRCEILAAGYPTVILSALKNKMWAVLSSVAVAVGIVGVAITIRRRQGNDEMDVEGYYPLLS